MTTKKKIKIKLAKLNDRFTLESMPIYWFNDMMWGLNVLEYLKCKITLPDNYLAVLEKLDYDTECTIVEVMEKADAGPNYTTCNVDIKGNPCDFGTGTQFFIAVNTIIIPPVKAITVQDLLGKQNKRKKVIKND